MLGDDYVISVTVWWKELSHCEETYAWVNLIFISWIHFFWGGDYFSGRICCTFTIMASSVSLQGSQSLEHEKLARRVFKSRKPGEDLLSCWRKQRWGAVDGMITVQVSPDTFSKQTNSSGGPLQTSLSCYWHLTTFNLLLYLQRTCWENDGVPFAVPSKMRSLIFL